MVSTHPWPIFTKLRYNLVGSASVQICCRRFTISASLSLSFSFFSRLLGVATPAAFAKLDAAGLGCAGARARSGVGPTEVFEVREELGGVLDSADLPGGVKFGIAPGVPCVCECA